MANMLYLSLQKVLLCLIPAQDVFRNYINVFQVKRDLPTVCLYVCVCSGITCCRADVRLRQQDLGEHGARRSHWRIGRPASPHLQNLDKPRSTERSGLNITTVLSHCNYAPLCMPLQPRLHTHCSSNKRTYRSLYVCVLVLAMHPYGLDPSFLSLHTARRVSTSLSPDPSREPVGEKGKVSVKASDG